MIAPVFLFLLLFFFLSPYVSRFSFSRLHGFRYSSPSRTLTIVTLALSLRLPSPSAPYWALLTAQDCAYRDLECSVRVASLSVKLWFFPVFFRASAGPWVATTLDGFTVNVFTSKRWPAWIQLLRNNLAYSVLDGDTIRLDQLKTTLQLPRVVEADTVDQLPASVSLKLVYWKVVNRNLRSYTLGHVEANLKRDWSRNQGSLVIVALDSTWDRLPDFEAMDWYWKSHVIWRLFRGIFSFPANIFKICIDPLETVDISVSRCDVTFEDFRIRDAELIQEVMTKIHQEHTMKPGGLWTHSFIQGLFTILGN